MQTFWVQLPTFLIFFFMLAPCWAAQRSITVCGTGDSQILFTHLAQKYMRTHPDITIDNQDSIGSSGGIRKVAAGECELGRTARDLHDNEKKYALSHRVFAYSPIVFICNKNVAIETISARQVAGIFSGTITNWQELGGQDAPVYIAKREVGDSSRLVLEKKIPALAERPVWAGKTTYTTEDTVSTVERYSNTVSFAPLAAAKGHSVKILKFNNVAPSQAHIRSGKYPLVVKLGIVWTDAISPAARDFADFISTPPAATVINEAGALPARAF